MEPVEKTEAFVKQKLSGEATGHDWFHTLRVHDMAVRIAESEGADLQIVRLAALLHDLDDWKFSDAGTAPAKKWLEDLELDEEVVDHVLDIISSLSFKGAGVETPMKTLEGKVVQDADRLDAMGAIGIARTFAYGGATGQPIHDPGLGPTMHESFEAYKDGRTTTINHFHEKLLLLAQRMNTPAAQKIAFGRHRFMEEFLQRFSHEWDSKL